MQVKWLAALALAWSCCAVAQDASPAVDFRAMTDAELRERLDAARTEGFARPCATKVPLFDELARRNPEHAGYKALRLQAAAFCAYEEDRYAEGLASLKQAERDFPAVTYDTLGLYFANRLDDGAEALARLRHIAASGQLRDLPDTLTFAAIRTIRRAGPRDDYDAFAYELTATDGFAGLDPGVQGAFVGGALRHAARIGDPSRVAALLAYDLNPQGFEDLLYQRDYEPIWPQIEAFAGDHLASVSDAYVKATAGRLADKPEDLERLSANSHALLFAGRFQEVVDLARSWRPDRDNLEGLQEPEAWALNNEAFALDALGRRAEGDKVFDRLAALSPEIPWVVNFVINRGSRLVGQERWEEGLAASELAWTVADTHGSTYAKLLVARDRACALQHLGRGDEAARDLAFLVEHFDDYAPIAATGLLCAGRRAEVERLVAAALSREVPRGAVLNEMQDSRFELFYTPSSLPRLREVILADEALRSEALKHVRVLPDRFVPIAFQRRQELADATAAH